MNDHKPTLRLFNVPLFLRCLPIAAIAALAGTGFIVANPGLFWDDWVWWFQSPESNIQIGKELGIWWGGYLSNAIYGATNPVLVLRLMALFSWIVSAIAFSYVAARTLRLDVRESIELFLLIAVCHIGLIRFINSVALYNVYIMSFWLGAALLAKFSFSPRLSLLSLPFFFFSFYLNSFLSVYVLILAALFFYCAGGNFITLSKWASIPTDWRLFRQHVRTFLSELYSVARGNVVPFMKRHWAFVLLPLVFIAQKRLLAVSSDFYGDYNSISAANAWTALSKTFSVLAQVLKDYFHQLSHDVPPGWIAIAAVAAFLAILVLPRQKQNVVRRQIMHRLLVAVTLAYFAVLPYVVVNKPPNVRDFYESRHILVAIPALMLFVHALLFSTAGAYSRGKWFAGLTRSAILALLIGASVGASTLVAFRLWKDWYRQIAILDHLKRNADSLMNARLFIFEDLVPMKIGDRKIWNYEYTGMLVRAFGDRSRMGVSLQEYQSWPKKIALLNNGKMKERFNMSGFNFGDGSPIAITRTVVNNGRGFERQDFYEVAKSLLSGQPLPEAEKFTAVSTNFADIEVDRRVREMHDLLTAIFNYRKNFGYFPRLDSERDEKLVSLSGHVIKTFGGTFFTGAPDVIGDIPGLFPTYMVRPNAMNRSRDNDSYYIYLSDGADFKLVYVDAGGMAYAKQAHPFLVDKVRGGYGFWTDGAIDW